MTPDDAARKAIHLLYEMDEMILSLIASHRERLRELEAWKLACTDDGK